MKQENKSIGKLKLNKQTLSNFSHEEMKELKGGSSKCAQNANAASAMHTNCTQSAALTTC